MPMMTLIAIQATMSRTAMASAFMSSDDPRDSPWGVPSMTTKGTAEGPPLPSAVSLVVGPTEVGEAVVGVPAVELEARQPVAPDRPCRRGPLGPSGLGQQ